LMKWPKIEFGINFFLRGVERLRPGPASAARTRLSAKAAS
jgi:hypothetical protein